MLRTTREIGASHRKKPDTTSTRIVDSDKEAVERCAPYTASFNHLLSELPKRRNKHVVLLIMERMKAERIPLDQTTYNLLLEKVVDLPDDIAFTIYEQFKEDSLKDDAVVRPDLYTFHLMMRACERNSDYKTAFHLYAQMKELFGLYPDLALYNTLIGYCAPLNDQLTASFIVEEMRDRCIDLDVHTYNCLMNVFSQSSYEVNLQMFEDMVKRKIRPNRRTYNTLMEACQKAGDYDRAFQFFEELKKEGLTPDVTTYNVLITMCRDRLDYVFGVGKHSSERRTKEQRETGMKAVAELSMALFGEMEDIQVFPNTYTYNALLAVLGRCLDRQVFEVFDQMKNDNRSAHQAQLLADAGGSLSWTTENALGSQSSALTLQSGGTDLVSVDPSLDDLNDARIAGVGVAPNLETYTTMIEASERLGENERAHNYFAELKANKHIKLNKYVYIKMMDVCSIKSEKQTAFRLFDEAETQGIPQDTQLYNALMNVLAECSDPGIEGVFERLKSDKKGLGIKPDQDSYNILLKAYYKMKNSVQAFAVYKEMSSPGCPIKPDVVTYGILLDVCAMKRDVKLASELILDLKARNVTPSISTYCRLMNVFVQANDPGIATVFEDIKQHGPKPNLEAYTVLLTFYQNNNDEQILQVFADMKKAGVDPDLNSYNIMMNYCAAIVDSHRATKFFEELKVRGLNADIHTYNALIAVFAPTPGHQFVFKVFDEMAECNIAPDSTTFAILGKHPAGRKYLASMTTKLILNKPNAEQPKEIKDKAR